MNGVQRISKHLLGILDVLLAAHERGEEVYGAIVMKRTGESSACVYPALDRLEAEGWLTRRWEDPVGAPSRRYCQLTDAGVVTARNALTRDPARQAEPPVCATP